MHGMDDFKIIMTEVCQRITSDKRPVNRKKWETNLRCRRFTSVYLTKTFSSHSQVVS